LVSNTGIIFTSFLYDECIFCREFLVHLDHQVFQDFKALLVHLAPQALLDLQVLIAVISLTQSQQ
jgi:Na+-translocating ferredoxin:NAD+ oxidoreductase RnfE subunit